MEICKYTKLLLATSILALPGAAYASDGTVSFTGAVTSSTCTVSLNGGSASGTVTLPTVSSSALPAAGNTAGSTPFTLDVSACTFTGGNTTVTAYFEAGANVDPVTGRLNNAGTASNVQLQLFLGNNYASKIAAGQATQSTAAALSASGQLRYGVEYYATAAAGAGSVSSSVTYSLIYS